MRCPATGVVRWPGGFDVVEQNEYPRDIMAQLAGRVGWIESESRRLVKAMRTRGRVVAPLPELLQRTGLALRDEIDTITAGINFTSRK